MYDKIPPALRVQVVHIWKDVLGGYEEYANRDYFGTYECYKFIVETLCREYGVFRFPRPKRLSMLLNWEHASSTVTRGASSIESDRTPRSLPMPRSQNSTLGSKSTPWDISS